MATTIIKGTRKLSNEERKMHEFPLENKKEQENMSAIEE